MLSGEVLNTSKRPTKPNSPSWKQNPIARHRRLIWQLCNWSLPSGAHSSVASTKLLGRSESRSQRFNKDNEPASNTDEKARKAWGFIENHYYWFRTKMRNQTNIFKQLSKALRCLEVLSSLHSQPKHPWHCHRWLLLLEDLCTKSEGSIFGRVLGCLEESWKTLGILFRAGFGCFYSYHRKP